VTPAPRRRHGPAAIPAIVLLCALAAAPAATGAEAGADSTGAGGLLDAVSGAQAQRDTTAAAQAAVDTLADGGYLSTWTRKPSAESSSGIRSTSVGVGFDNYLNFRDGGSLSQTWKLSHEDYRSQEKIVDKRDLSVSYNTDANRRFQAGLNLGQNWSEDEVITSSGLTNVNKRDFRRAGATLKRDSLVTYGVAHSLSLNGAVEDQKGEQQRQRNDISAARLSGALRSGWRAADWLSFSSGLYAETESGGRSLGLRTDPSSSSGDTVRAGMHYDRGPVRGGFTVRSSSFEKRYLDYNRNSNGVIDTIGVAQKVVEELETNDATTVEWSNDLALRGFSLRTKVAKDFTENAFRRSGVGRKERSTDTVTLDAGFRLSDRDSITAGYGYLWKWDDQIYQGAEKPRGKQINYRRDLSFNWIRRLFQNTQLKVTALAGLTQDIAVGEFNKNDRDRLDSSVSVSTSTQWPGGVKVDMSFEAYRVEDISIQSERSANNNVKDTYEFSPGYAWPIASWLDLNQVFRLWIQYTDYVFSEYDDVTKVDDFNRRGNLDTKLDIKPNRRLTITVQHNSNVKLDGSKTVTDAAGRSYYVNETSQKINKINVAVNWKVMTWLTLEATTFKERDLKETFGDLGSATERFSGDLGIGGSVDKSFGGGRTIKASVRKMFAHGPNVQQAGRDYWDADVKVNWSF